MPLYFFGSNSKSQLSLGHTNDVSSPTPCIFDQSSSPPPAIPPQSIITGGNHTLLLYPTGEVYAAGLNSSGQCGFLPSSVGDILSTFRQLPAPPPPEDPNDINPTATQWGFCTAGWEFTILVTKDGKRVYTCGSGPKGELGLGRRITTTVPRDLRSGSSLTPSIAGMTICQIPNFPPEGTYITYLTSSITHVIAVLNTGKAWGWGVSRKNQLSRLIDEPVPHVKITHTPRAISDSSVYHFPIAKAACAQDSSLLLSTSGPEMDYLGYWTTKWGLHENKPLSCLGFVDVQASWNGFYLLKDTGEIVAWGRGDKGQLPPDGLKGVKLMAVGSEHVVAVVEEEGREKLVAWGWGEHGNCGQVEEGNGDAVPLREVKIPGVEGKEGRIRCIGAGCATSWVWVDWE